MEELVATVELDHSGGDAIEKVSVVTDDDEAAAEAREVPFEPGDRGEIEMVRRFVQDQELGRVRKHPSERYALGLTAGELGDL